MTATEVRDAASRLVERTCAAQGVPARIADPAALARLAALVAPPVNRAANNQKAGEVGDVPPAPVLPDDAGRVSGTPAASGRRRSRSDAA